MKYDVFISYRREGGYDTAKHLNDLLVRDGYKVSFDIDTLRNGDFDTQLLERIEHCKDFILIVDEHAFDRTLDPEFDPKKDWLRCELAYALKHKKNVIPVFLSGVSGFPEGLPADVVGVAKKNGPEYNKYYFDDFYKKLCSRFLKSRSVKRTIIFGLLALALIVTASVLFTMYKMQDDMFYVDPMVPHSTDEIEMNEYIHNRLNDAIDSLGLADAASAKTYWENDTNEDSEVYLGMCYMVGYGCSPNIKRAIKHIEDIACKGDATAQYLLGACYDNGIGVKQNLELAAELYLKAAEQGVVEAQCDYGIACSNNWYEAQKWLLMAAEQGNAKAQYTMGWYYGNNNDYKTAISWMEKAAEQNDTLALVALANVYRLYFGDYDEAFEIYESLAEQNNALAQYGLAVCLYNGLGTDVDIDLAIEYLKKSAEQGYAVAITDLGHLYLQGSSVNTPQDSNLAMELFKKAADLCYPYAQFVIGRMYENGVGVDQNSREAEKWYKKAERQGVSKASMQQMQQYQMQQYQMQQHM